MKKLLVAAALTCTLAIAGVAGATMAFANDGQNPVMNYVGRYGENRATIDVEAAGDADAKIHVSWGASAWETAEWDMSGAFDADTLTVSYDNCVKKVVTFEDEASSGTEEVVYENGKGSFTFAADGTLTWDDQEEHIADGTVFTFSGSAAPAEPAQLLGGWKVAEDTAITDEISAMLKTGLESYEGGAAAADYTPVAYLGSQLVSGTNHAVLCKSADGWAVVYLYQDLKGNVSVMNIAPVVLGMQ